MVSITFDEVWTISSFAGESVMHIINYTPTDANNHMLNTLLVKLFFWCMGSESVFIARLPNVLGFVMYAWFGYRLCYKNLKSYYGLACYLGLMLNPFVMDFFSLARGYGIGLAFQVGSIYFLLEYFKGLRVKQASQALLFGALAVLCSFSILNYWLALIGVIVFLSWYKKGLT